MKDNVEIIKITDEDIGGKNSIINEWKERMAARGIVIRDDNKIALFYKAQKNEYKLPGGGIENGETSKEAFKREVLEETGCKVEIIDQLCITEEYKSQRGFKQTSYAYIGKVIEDTNQLNLTEKEKAENSKLLWVDPEEALKLIENCFDFLKPSNFDKLEDVYSTKFIIKRDSLILKKYLYR